MTFWFGVWWEVLTTCGSGPCGTEQCSVNASCPAPAQLSPPVAAGLQASTDPLVRALLAKGWSRGGVPYYPACKIHVPLALVAPETHWYTTMVHRQRQDTALAALLALLGCSRRRHHNAAYLLSSGAGGNSLQPARAWLVFGAYLRQSLPAMQCQVPACIDEARGQTAAAPPRPRLVLPLAIYVARPSQLQPLPPSTHETSLPRPIFCEQRSVMCPCRVQSPNAARSRHP